MLLDTLIDGGTRVFVDRLKDMEPAKTTPEASSASDLHSFVSFSSHQRVKASLGLSLVWSLARFLFFFFSSSLPLTMSSSVSSPPLP